jgi:hypothetical protein
MSALEANFARVPTGFVPIGKELLAPGIDPSQIPQTLNDLDVLISFTYDLTVSKAMELNIPVVGSGSGGFERRVLLEWTRIRERANRILNGISADV